MRGRSLVLYIFKFDWIVRGERRRPLLMKRWKTPLALLMRDVRWGFHARPLKGDRRCIPSMVIALALKFWGLMVPLWMAEVNSRWPLWLIASVFS